MARIKSLFRVLAVLNALLLLGAYVCYRGGIVQALMTKPAQQAAYPVTPVQSDPKPVVQAQPAPQVDETPAEAPEDTRQQAARPTVVHSEIADYSMSELMPSAPNRKLPVSNSKTITVDVTPIRPSATASTKPAPAASAQQQTPIVQQRLVLMAGSKSAGVSIFNDEATSQPAPAQRDNGNRTPNAPRQSSRR